MWIKQFAAGVAGAMLVMGVSLSQDVRAVAAALVNVTNTNANPVPTRPADLLNTFAMRIFPTARNYASIPVPPGKYLVITSVTGFNNSGQASDVEIGTVSGGLGSSMRFPFHRPQSNGLWYLENQNTQLVADPGTSVTAVISGPSTDSGGINIDVRGYYVPAN